MFHVIGRKQYNGYQPRPAFLSLTTLCQVTAAAIPGRARCERSSQETNNYFVRIWLCYEERNMSVLFWYIFLSRRSSVTAGQVVSSRQCVKQETAERRGRRGGKSRNLVIVIFAPGSLGLPGSPWELRKCNHAQLLRSGWQFATIISVSRHTITQCQVRALTT